MNPGASRPSILVVEDERPVRRAVVRILTGFDFDAIEAANGAEAIATVRARPVDLVLCDIRMPDMAGPDVVRELKAIRPDIGVLFMTGYAGSALPPEVAYDPDLVIQKPFGPDELHERITKRLPRAKPSLG
ncbi:MAG: response regulator [Deltaproteobacteria bacterium]|nr:response regulator [Deltaproteobacteria bacterium]